LTQDLKLKQKRDKQASTNISQADLDLSDKVERYEAIMVKLN